MNHPQDLEFHPSPEELLDYHAGDLSEDERERVQEHLALCPACARTVLGLASFPDVEPSSEEDRLSDGDLAAEWQRFRRSVDAAPSAVSSPHLTYALAASLLLAVVGLSLWVGYLRGEVSALSGPRVNVHVADLIPLQGAVERSTSDEEAVRVPSWSNRLLLILNLAEVPSDSEYRMEIATTDGKKIWSRSGLRLSADGNFTLEVPRRFLPAGSYRLRLYGLPGKGRPVAEYAVRIQPE